MNLSSNPWLVNNERYVGVIISQKPMKLAAIQIVLKLAWEMYGSVTISDVSKTVVLFEFENE